MAKKLDNWNAVHRLSNHYKGDGLFPQFPYRFLLCNYRQILALNLTYSVRQFASNEPELDLDEFKQKFDSQFLLTHRYHMHEHQMSHEPPKYPVFLSCQVPTQHFACEERQKNGYN